MTGWTITFDVRLPGWSSENGELCLAIWEGDDGKPDQRFWLPAKSVDKCTPVGRRWKGYELYDVKISVLPDVVHAVWETGLAQTAYSAAAVALYYTIKGGKNGNL